MTERVKKYIEIGKQFTFDFVENNENEYNKLSAERQQLKQQMTIDELKSLEGHISAREFHMGIVPLINQKKAEQKAEADNVKPQRPVSDKSTVVRA
jgi:hypothetical protein